MNSQPDKEEAADTVLKLLFIDNYITVLRCNTNILSFYILVQRKSQRILS